MSEALRIIAWVSLSLSVICSALILIDIARGRTQRMWIMKVVWPVSVVSAREVPVAKRVIISSVDIHSGGVGIIEVDSIDKSLDRAVLYSDT